MKRELRELRRRRRQRLLYSENTTTKMHNEQTAVILIHSGIVRPTALSPLARANRVLHR